MKPNLRTCRVCGCTDTDCRQCIHKTSRPCSWVEADLCSACMTLPATIKGCFHPISDPGRKFSMTFTADLTPGNENDIALEHVNTVLAETGLKDMIVTGVWFTYNHLHRGRLGLRN